MRVSKYSELININKKHYLFNLNNGTLIKLNNKLYGILIKIFDNFEYVNLLDEKELSTLKKYQFIVNDDFDNNQNKINHITYSISKYNNYKEHLKIDFALTNRCNFCCPYCFESNSLNKCDNYNKSKLIQTGKNLQDYIEFHLKHGVKNVSIVFYGGEPSLEKDFTIDFINNLKFLCKNYNAKLKYTFITNGFLFDKDFITRLDVNYCDFVQITLDGEKEFHNSRRTNLMKINTFDRIIENINLLIEHKFNVVIRLNIDKTNFFSVLNLVNNVKQLFCKNLEFLKFDVARVFGSKESFDLEEYEYYRTILVKKLMNKNLIIPRLVARPLTTFCIAESLSNDLVIDYQGYIYRCWNNVFDKNYKTQTINQLISNEYEILDYSNITLEFVEGLSLEAVNNKNCFDCKYCKFCQGLCPAIRKNIIIGNEKNIYDKDICKKIILNRIKEIIEIIGE